MKKLSQSRVQSGMFIALVFGMVSLLGSVAVAQSGTQTEPATPAAQAVPASQQILGTWTIDLEKTKEMVSEEGFEKISKQMEGGVITMTFGAGNQFSLDVGGFDAMVRTPYTFEAVEGEENTFAIVVTTPGGDSLKAKASFIDENNMKFTPEGETSAVMVRTADAEPGPEAVDGSMKKMEDE